ncbi:MAG: hypothetical protein HDQ88_05655 [Clostridia bacterium]|nr:hypothetical protein [Clostridia bacterium]
MNKEDALLGCAPRFLPVCEPEELTPPAQESCPSWELCLPWGGKLWSTDGCVRLAPGKPPKDGVYGKVIIANGCLVGVAEENIPQFIAAPCAPSPSPCSGAVEGQQLDPSVTPGNLYTTDAAGRPLVLCRIEAGDNVIVSGDGTLTNPYVISARIETQVMYARSSNEAIAVTGSGGREDPIVITHKSGHQGTVNGLTFDAQGHLVDVDTSAASPTGVQGIIPGDGIDATFDHASGIATVSLSDPPTSRAGTYQLGGYDIDLDAKNRITRIDKSIDLGGSQQIAAGTSAITVNEQGSIESIETAPLATGFNIRWQEGRAATRRTATFTMRYDAPLAGVLYTTGTTTFFQRLLIFIDDVPCQLTPLGIATASYGVAFTGLGIFGVGEHTLDIRAQEAWVATAAAQAILWPCTLADSTSEE